jgi:hypothetical protein
MPRSKSELDANAPSQSVAATRPPPRRGIRRWTLAIVLSAIMLVAVFAAFALVGVAQTTPFSFSIRNPGGSIVNVTHQISFANSGTVLFTWVSTGIDVTFSVRVGMGVTPLISESGTSGNGSLHVVANTVYSFGTQEVPAISVTVSVSGKLEYSAPILTL